MRYSALMSEKKAFITGITGQDGSYLAELLLSKGYEVHGLVRAHSSSNLENIRGRVVVHEGSLDNHDRLREIVKSGRPDECYHLAGATFIGFGYKDESKVLNSNLIGTHVLIGAIAEYSPACRFFFAGSAEMFGISEKSPQNEQTPFNPQTVYGIAKVASYSIVRFYREKHNLFACTGILFNHESPRRGEKFVTRKITSSAARIKLGLEKKLTLGNMDVVRDWGYAPDFVDGFWRMLQHQIPDDFVFATGVGHTVHEFADIAFRQVGLDYRDYVESTPSLVRSAETLIRVGDSSKARHQLGWSPSKGFKELVEEMVSNDLRITKENKS
jgi:GDPmannose 4,6-dehydratase